MVYKKHAIIAIIISIVAAVVTNVVFATTDFFVNDKILDSTMTVLIFIQKYSWPLITLLMLFALYKFYVIGSELLEEKMKGQKMIIGIAIFLVIVQCLPLIYAFFVVR